ncbi:EAL domain-containing protein [Ideonella oryzae]|uniref:EAL domain-containing protein n=1 Tax=Ideonella oryzae TaxID=2937441 RepID=A0ABT1BKH9_9BURK|nr:EAL domain-containing protein [Ideonella oryzae]MCO5976349.1 EAL domain-containing protein [Ideonella oryzae]
MSAEHAPLERPADRPVDVTALLAPPGVHSQWITAVLELTEVALVLVQAQGVRYANPAARRLLAWGDTPLVNHQLTDWVAPEDRPLIAEQLRRRLAGEPGQFWEVQGLRRDGSRFDVRLYGQPVLVDGHPADLVTLFDVSETREALRQAQWNADLLDHSEHLSRSGSYVLGWPEGRLRPSAGLRQLVGTLADAGAADPEAAWAWVAPEDRARVMQAWREARPDEPFQLQHRALGAQGQWLQVVHRGMLQKVSQADALQGIGLVQDISRQHEAEQRVQTLAQYDVLTGLPNRAHFIQQLASRMQIARWDRSAFLLMVVELPQLQELRVTLGHEAAQTVLRTLASRLQQQAREQELVARVSGQDLALMGRAEVELLPDAVHEQARQLRRVLQAPMLVGAAEVLPRCRIGLAMFPGDGQDGETLLEAAEKACALADEAGGVAFARAEAHAHALREMQVASALRHALERQELRLVYQPQVSLTSGAIVGVEALARWNSPRWGEVPPTEFIAVAERTGMIGELGHWVLETACRQWVAWRTAGLSVPRVAVNVSPHQLRRGDLALKVQRVLLDTGMDPRGLGIELTESAVMDDPARAGQALSELRALGVEVALDDFGTGYSSLACLRSLPIDVVKLDRSFVSDVDTAPESMALTRAILTMAHGLGMQVLAEGVEREDQLNLLRAKGCDLIQGYWFSPPVAPQALSERLSEGWRLAAQHLSRDNSQRTLLLVDDEDNILAALRRLLRRDGYEILTARNGDEALRCLAEHPVDVILSDQRMPGMTGVEFLHRAAALYPDTVRMTLSGFTDLQSIIDAVNEGAVYKFLTKPWDDDRLRAHVAEAFRRKGMADENRRLSAEVETTNALLAHVNSQLSAALERQREQGLLLQASVGGVREILDSLPLAVIGVDPDGLLVYANEAAHRLFPPEALALGVPTQAGVDGLAPADGEARCLVQGCHCRVWRYRLGAGSGPWRGDVLICLPLSQEVCHESA